MNDRELMHQALDAMLNFPNDISDEMFESIRVLRARLAQPEPEPVAWVETLENAQPHCVTDLKYCSVMQHERGEHLKYIPLYLASPQREWQTLTENEIKHLWYEACQTNLELTSQLIVHLARNIEAKLKEKNT